MASMTSMTSMTSQKRPFSPSMTSPYPSFLDPEPDTSTNAREYILNPHPTVAKQIRQHLNWKTIAVVLLTVVILIFTQLMLGDTEFKHDGGVVPHWKVFLVLNGSVLMVLLMVFGLPCEAVLLTGAAIYGICGVIDCSDVLRGLMDSTVTSVALLFPIGKAISDTGVLSAFIGKVLGTPGTVRTAVFRLYLLVGLLSSVVNNTPMIAMMLPILRLWSLRLGFDVAQLAMPMGFASQLGGSLTLMGSPTNFAAKSAFRKFGYMFGFFELSFPAAILFLLGLVFSVVFAPLLLGRRSLGLDDHAVDARKPVEAFFQVAFTVQARGTFDGLKVSLAGFTRLPDIRSVESVIRDNIFIDLENNDETLVGGDHILFRASADGIVGLRSTRGLCLPYEPELQRLGANRRERAVFEVELLETSALIGVPLTMRSLCFTHKCAILAVRKQLGKVDESRLQYESHSFTPSWNDSSSGDRGSSTGPRPAFFPRLTFNDYIPSRGDVFLVEANCSEVDCDPWLRDFGLVRMIGGSTPPRIGRLQDRLRSILVILGSILAICLYVVGDVAEQPYNPALKNLTLTNNLLLLMAVFLIAKVFTIQEVYESMDVSVLMWALSHLVSQLRTLGLQNGLRSLWSTSWAISARGAFLWLFISSLLVLAT
jgi:hypothetical protein